MPGPLSTAHIDGMYGASVPQARGADMGRLLAALIADSETRAAANPANPANLSCGQASGFADSQDSQAFGIEAIEAPSARFADSQDSQDQRATAARLLAARLRLLELADAAGIDPAAVHSMPAADLADLLVLTDGSD